MWTQDPEFLKQLQTAFHSEAAEHLQAMSAGLLQLEKAAPGEKSRTVLEGVFREAHSLKGAARAVNLPDVESLCQAMESAFAAWKRQATSRTPAEFDIVHQALDLIAELVTQGEQNPHAGHDDRVDVVRQQLAQSPQPVLPGSPDRHPPTVHESSPTAADSPPQPLPEKLLTGAALATSDTIRIATVKLDTLLRQAEELLALKLTSQQRLIELRQLQVQLQGWEEQWAKLDPDQRALRQAVDQPTSPAERSRAISPSRGLLQFLEWNQAWYKSVEDQLAALLKVADHDHRVLAGMVDHLLADAKQLVLQPFATLLAVVPKLVRDLCRDQAKQVELTICGGEVEIDKRVLEEMKDPLIHLVRNCIDHGLEKPDAREQQHKPPQGTLTITVSQTHGNQVEILVVDDGRGIDAARVRQAAVKNGTVSQVQAGQLGDREALYLIFQSGVSTSPLLTEISGRGLGLAIVREKVERLGGEIFVETNPGQGTTFRVRLPLTLATFRGILVQAADQLFVIPTAHVERVVRVRRSEVKTVENQDTVVFGAQAVALVRLQQVLELPSGPAPDAADEFISAVVLGAEEKRIAFAVDAVLLEQEVLVKGLGRLLARVRNIAGATVLGSGKPVLILNVPDLLKSATQAAGTRRLAAPAAAVRTSQREQSLLVVEDSITARMLLKNILESAGYRVKTAVDGMEGWAAVKSEPFDLVVSDIQMPRLDGFDLTAKIRGDQELRELPVILVTGLVSREDRERGIDVGANAYIVKRDFDPSNLLEVIHRLIR
ncbi:MAG: response regulator [Planctomycetota bacterium]|nr:response regulator [Planctomycetota bacterium]